MTIAALIIFIFYNYQILSYLRGWNRLSTEDSGKDVAVTVIVAFRNEALRLPSLLNDLKHQNYPSTNIQYIFVDDSSEDSSFNIVDSFPIKKEVLKSPHFGKKAAIECAMQYVKNDIILTTDADCRVGPNWVRKMTTPFTQSKAQLAFGPVAFSELITLFDKLQAIEFMSLIASGAGAAGNKKPFMCNAANLAFRKSVFENTEQQIASGDDVFLLHHVKRNNGIISFVKERDAIVLTKPKAGISDFINQRKRWASKTSSYKDISALWSASIVLLTNLLLLYFLLTFQFEIFTVLYLLKSIVDYRFLKKASVFFQMEHLMYLFWGLQIIYPFYIVWVGISSQLSSYNWKGRAYKK